MVQSLEANLAVFSEDFIFIHLLFLVFSWILPTLCATKGWNNLLWLLFQAIPSIESDQKITLEYLDLVVLGFFHSYHNLILLRVVPT